MMTLWCIVLLFNLFHISQGRTNRVLLRDVSTLTFSRGQSTNARRSTPIPQLKCVGGSAYHEHNAYPSAAQCYNRGFDGQDVQWECKAVLPSSVFLGRVSVNCEGYDYPDDPYILAGSCGLEYELEYADGVKSRIHKKHLGHTVSRLLASPDIVKYSVLLGLLGSAALIWYCCLSGTVDDRGEQAFARRGGRYTPVDPPPYPEGDPPSYDEAVRDRPPPPDDDAWVHRRAEPSAPPHPSYGWADLPSGTSSNPGSSSSHASRRTRPPNTPRKTETTTETESNLGSWLTHGLSAGAGFLGGYLLRSATGGETNTETVNSTRTRPTFRTEQSQHTPLYPTFEETQTRHSSNNDDDDRRHVSTSYGGTTRR